MSVIAGEGEVAILSSHREKPAGESHAKASAFLLYRGPQIKPTDWRCLLTAYCYRVVLVFSHRNEAVLPVRVCDSHDFTDRTRRNNKQMAFSPAVVNQLGIFLHLEFLGLTENAANFSRLQFVNKAGYNENNRPISWRLQTENMHGLILARRKNLILEHISFERGENSTA